jgi:hypothetical protein
VPPCRTDCIALNMAWPHADQSESGCRPGR